MKRWIQYSLLVLLLLVMIHCQRENVIDKNQSILPLQTQIAEDVVWMDTLIFTNPVLTPGQVRFDLLGEPPDLPDKAVFVYAAKKGLTGRITSLQRNDSRIYIQFEAVTFEDIFSQLSIDHSVDESMLYQEEWNVDPEQNGDTITLRHLGYYLDSIIYPGFLIHINKADLIFDPSIRFFIQLTSSSDGGAIQRFQFQLAEKVFAASDLVVNVSGPCSLNDSVKLFTRSYGPFSAGGLPMFYQQDFWLGYRTDFERAGHSYLKSTIQANTDLRATYNYWEGWNQSIDVRSSVANIDSLRRPSYINVGVESRYTSVWTAIVAGDTIGRWTEVCLTNAKGEVTFPNYTNSETIEYAIDYQSMGNLIGGLTIPEEPWSYHPLSTNLTEGVYENQPPKPLFEITPPRGYVATEFNFDASTSWDIEDPTTALEFRWDFDGDGNFDTPFSKVQTGAFQYAIAGVYSVVLEVRDRGGLVSRTIQVLKVEETSSAPIAYFTISPESGRTNNYYIFDASGSTDLEDESVVLKVRWDWENDGIWDTEFGGTKVAVHFYREAGTYVIKLEVKDTQGLTGSTSKFLQVLPANIRPTAFFEVQPTSGTTETTFRFDGSGSSDPEDPLEELQVRWDWENNGTWDTGYRFEKTITHQFLTAGTFRVVMEIKDTEDLTHNYSVDIVVTNPNVAPNADFTINPTTGTIDTEFTFDASISTDPEDSIDLLEVRWDWNNDDVYDTDWSYDKVILKKFDVTGTKIIKVMVRDSGGLTDTKARLFTIN